MVGIIYFKVWLETFNIIIMYRVLNNTSLRVLLSVFGCIGIVTNKDICRRQFASLHITNHCLQQQRYEKSCSLLSAYRCSLDLCNSLPFASFTIMYHVSLPDLITCQFCSMNLHSSNLVSSTSERTSWGRKCL